MAFGGSNLRKINVETRCKLMNIDYPLEWFDDLIMNSQHHQNEDLEGVGQPGCEEIKKRADLESSKIKSQLKRQVFAISRQKEKEIVVRQYHSSLIMLHDYSREKHYPVSVKGQLESSDEHILSTLEELISFIESRFLPYLNQEDQAPQSYLARTQADIREKLPFLHAKLDKFSDAPKTVDIIINGLRRFSSSESQLVNVTFKEIQYQRELMQTLCELDVDSTAELDYTALDKALIYLNYNSKSYIQHLRSTIIKRVHQSSSIPAKIDQLSLSHKVFSQLFRKTEVVLNRKFQDIHQVMNHWFAQEIAYLERKMKLTAVLPNGQSVVASSSSLTAVQNSKLLCSLSIDQIALALSAMDDLRILTAKSKSRVFQVVVPFLSTLHRDELSPGSMRGKAYTAEERDKEIIIETLERIIKKIREY